jgi:hypothetical protein
LIASQCTQGRRRRTPPHSLQNFAPAGLACWQKEQETDAMMTTCESE